MGNIGITQYLLVITHVVLEEEDARFTTIHPDAMTRDQVISDLARCRTSWNVMDVRW